MLTITTIINLKKLSLKKLTSNLLRNSIHCSAGATTFEIKASSFASSLFITQRNNYYLINFIRKLTNSMSVETSVSVDTKMMLERVQRIIPPLTEDKHKGQAGRIGIIGGSPDYTGAPYFAGISALRSGADIVHIFCHSDAAPVIKSYSPELIVHPLLDDAKAMDKIEPWLERLHVLIVGPGLGRDRQIIQTVTSIITFWKKNDKPLILDADGINLILADTYLLSIYNHVILTPNAVEFSKLFGSRRDLISLKLTTYGSGITILEKGKNDRVHIARTQESFSLPNGGSGRRCAGQGDLLAGALGTFYHWATETKDPNPELVACFAAAHLIKQCNANAYQKQGRSMLASDMLNEIHNVFEDYFENDIFQ